jgi:hypothetical protein
MKKINLIIGLFILAMITVNAKIKTITLSISQPNIENCITSIDNQFEGCQFKIYPNPGNGLFKVEINNNSSAKEANLTVHDISGKLIVNKRINMTGTQLQAIDLSGKPSGIYTLTITHGEKERFSTNLIKN